MLLGWRSRHLLLGDAEPLVISGGIFRPFVLVRGRAVGTWTISRRSVTLKPFGRLNRADNAALETEADDVTRFLGD